MMVRSLLIATALLTATTAAALAQGAPAHDDAILAPVLRAKVVVTGELVRVGDVIDNAGAAAQIAIYRAPDLGTTGSLPVAQILAALRAQQVIGVDAGNIKEVSVARLARSIEPKEIEAAVAGALAHRNGLGEAANISLTFDREIQDIRLEASNIGALQPVAARFEPRNGRFDVNFEVASDDGSSAARLRFTGTAVETVEAAVLMRDVERTDVLKASDIEVQRRPKAEIGGDAAARDRVIGMQMRRPLRAGQALKTADLVKPDLVQRDQSVTLISETAGLYLTVRGKAVDNGTEGDVVNVLNLQSKRTVTGVVIGRGQVAIQVATPRLPAVAEVTSSITPDQTAAHVSIAADTRSPTPAIE